MVAVFGKNEYAKKKDAIVINGKQVRFLLPANGARTVDIELPVGEYSIGIVHDENMNNKMDRILGMGPPSEGGGFTGGMGYTGPKSWDESKVTVPAAGLNVNVDLRYWN